MLRRLALAPVLTLSLLVPSLPASGSPPVGCSGGTAAAAARALVHPGAEVTDVGEVAGFRSALVLEPLVYPGVRHRLIQAGSYWCDAGGFNSAWRLAGRPDDALEMASAYVRIAPAAFFDGVTVRSVRAVAPGVVSLETHALTNGITAEWTVTVDAAGVRTATWTTTGLAVRPFTAQWEGVSALPGLRRAYRRAPDGSLAMTQALFSELTAESPGPFTEGVTADEFTIRLSFGDTHASPTPGMDTGNEIVDRPRIILKMLLDNYQEFYDWGLRKGWIGSPWGQDLLEDVGYVYFDSAISAYCWACVFIREDFNIHISSAVVQILEALGWEYPDENDALANVLGHEMVHNFQNAYYKPTQNNASTSTSFSEGTARFQESIHAYSGVSHQPRSLIYHTGRDDIPGISLAANSCNGWDGSNIEASFAGGPFTGKSYNACYFWLSWYPRHGTAGIVDLFEAMHDHATRPGHEEVIGALQQATGGTFADDLAAFAQASITGKGYEWAAPGTEEPVRDWGVHLDRWSPAMLEGTEWSRTIGNGGVTAREIGTGGYASSSDGTLLYVVRDDGATATRTLVDQSDEVADVVEPPAEGERVWLVAVYPQLGSTAATVRLSPQP